MRRKARGQQGSWSAHLGDTQFPCVHQRFLTGLDYFDPVEGVPLPDDYVQAVAAGRVILTKGQTDVSGRFKRTGYIALYRIEDFSFSQGQLRFRLAERLEDLS